MANITSLHASTGNRHVIQSWVRGVDVEITPDSFAQQFSLPRVEHPQFAYEGEDGPSHDEMRAEILVPGATWDTSQVRVRDIAPRYHPIFLWTCASVLPLGRTVECSRLRGQLMWAIGTGRTIDLPHFMYMALWAGTQVTTLQSSIVFGCFLTARIRAAGVGTADVILLTSKSDIGFATEKRAAGQLAKRGGGASSAHSTSEPPPSTSQPPQQEAQPEGQTGETQTQPQPQGQQAGPSGSATELIMQTLAAIQEQMTQERTERLQWQERVEARLEQQDVAIASLGTQLAGIVQTQTTQTTRLQEIIQHLGQPLPEDDDLFSGLHQD